MLNRVVLVGRITKDPELRNTNSNIPYCRFVVAVNRQFSNAQGDREADFVNCMVWRKQAENLAKFIKKGGLIGVDGRIQTGSYQAEDGNMRYTTDVVADSIQFLEPRTESSGNFSNASRSNDNSNFSNNRSNNNTNNRSNNNNNNNMNQQQKDPFFDEDISSNVDISEDDLPF